MCFLIYIRPILYREGAAFHQADLLIITDIYAAGETPIAGVTSELIADAVTAQAGPKTIRIRDLKEVVPYLLELIQPGDLVLTLGAGNVWTAGAELIQALAPVKQVIEA